MEDENLGLSSFFEDDRQYVSAFRKGEDILARKIAIEFLVGFFAICLTAWLGGSMVAQGYIFFGGALFILGVLGFLISVCGVVNGIEVYYRPPPFLYLKTS